MSDPVDAGERYYREATKRFLLFRFVIEVREDGVYLRFAPLHRSFQYIPFEDVESARAATYDPSTYGGWHWGVRRTLGGNRVYRLRCDRGVELVLSDDTRLFVGSEQPAELEAAIQRAMDTE
jgi:hypothetical protein